MERYELVFSYNKKILQDTPVPVMDDPDMLEVGNGG